MITYIQELAKELAAELNQQHTISDIAGRFAVLTAELDRLDPRDFIPVARAQFVQARRTIRNWSNIQMSEWRSLLSAMTGSLPSARWYTEFQMIADRVELPQNRRVWFQDAQPGNASPAAREVLKYAAECCTSLEHLLNLFGGQGSHIVPRSFDWIKKRRLRRIVERDYRELVLILFPGGAWKSTVVLAGSILEAILYHLLTHGHSWVTKAMAASKAPVRKTKATGTITPKDITKDEWTLEDLIKVAVELRLLPQQDESAIHQVLRKYRNFVHPAREVEMGIQLAEGEAMASVGLLKSICDHLEDRWRKK